jgi:hypothetical protein
MQARDDRSVHVLRDHEVIAKVERRRIDASSQQLGRIGEIRSVVRYRTTIRQIDGHAVTAPRATGALPIIGRQRRDVAHEYCIELADIYA